jgi:hypothetical protein
LQLFPLRLSFALFGDDEAVGQDVRIGSFGYRVVGVLGVKGMSPVGAGPG